MTDRLRKAARARQDLIDGAKRASAEISVEREAVLEARRTRRQEAERRAERDRATGGSDT